MTLFSNIAPQRILWVSASGNNANSGSREQPYKTIQAALDKATPGTTVMVKAGTYVENITFKNSGRPDAPIQLISADGTGAAKIKPAHSGTATISGFGEENLVVRGFDVTAQSKTNGIQFGMAGNDFKDMTKNIVIDHNIVRGAGQDSIKISQGDNIHILDNVLIGAGDQGIDFVAVNGSVIARNDISKVTGVAGLFVKGGSSNVRIENNRIHDVDVDGIDVGGWTDARWMRPGTLGYQAKGIVVTGNEVFDVGKRPLNFLGAVDVTATHNKLSGNPSYPTVVNIGAGKSGSTMVKSSDIDITNNTINRPTKWLTIESGQNNDIVNKNNRFDGVWNGKAGPVAATPPASGNPADPVDTITVTAEKYVMPDNIENAVIARVSGSTVTGNVKNNTIKGGAGRDVLDGGAGNDSLTGGAGNDVFVIAKGKGNDVITDFKAGVGAGDTVRLDGFLFSGFAAVKTAMKQSGSDVVLDLGGGQSLKFQNQKISNFVADDFGYASSPIFVPAPVTPQWKEGAGTQNTIKGSTRADNLAGTAKNDHIDGGSNHDTMTGGNGDDTYIVGSPLDKVVEKAGQGTDTIKAWVEAYALPDHVENLHGMSASGMTLTGNGMANIIKGDTGNDTITGGGGGDQLWGGGGRDAFVFKALSDKGDLVMDFSKSQDVLDLRPLMKDHDDYRVEVVAKSATSVAVWVHHHGTQVDELVSLAGIAPTDLASMQPGKAAWLLV